MKFVVNRYKSIKYTIASVMVYSGSVDGPVLGVKFRF